MGAAMLLLVGPAAAGEFEPVPCEDLHFRIAGEDVLAKCERRHEHKGN
jgi:hypothetical protein